MYLLRLGVRLLVVALQVRLEVWGQKVKNAFLVSGKKAKNIVWEIKMVEKMNTMKSTNCNERRYCIHFMVAHSILMVFPYKYLIVWLLKIYKYLLIYFILYYKSDPN
jgi:hypothetical protein